jgi:methyl-accepting chemotaxis protein
VKPGSVWVKKPAVAAPKAAQPGVERRGPNRATNVVRPVFDKPVAAASHGAVDDSTGSDDWTSF